MSSQQNDDAATDKYDVWLIGSEADKQHRHTRVADELDELGLDAELVDFEDMTLPEDENDFPYAARFILDKSMRLPFQYTMMDHLKRNGNTEIINDFVPMMNAVKAATYSIWKDEIEPDPNIPFKMPDTILTKDMDSAIDFIDEKGSVLFKPLYSGGGWGIERLESDDPELEDKLNEICCEGRAIENEDGSQTKLPPFGFFHLQEFIPNRNFDVRAISFKGEEWPFTMYARYNENDLHNMAQGGMGCKIKRNGVLKCYDEENDEFHTFHDKLTGQETKYIAKTATKALEMSGLDMAGIDIMPGQDGDLYLLEWNPSFQFKEGEKITGKNIGKKIAEYIKKKADKKRIFSGSGERDRVLVFRNSGKHSSETLDKGMDVFRERGFKIDYVDPKDFAIGLGTDNVDISFDNIDMKNYSCAVISGGGGSFAGVETKHFAIPEAKKAKEAMELKIPVLGICLGHQILNKGFDGEIANVRRRGCGGSINNNNYGVFVLGENHQRKCYKSIQILEPGPDNVIEQHRHKVIHLGKKMNQIATSYCTEVEGTCRIDAPAFSVQWHPEKEAKWRKKHSELMENFADLCVEYYKNGDVTGSLIGTGSTINEDE